MGISFPSELTRRISIHAPREGGDGNYSIAIICIRIFQSTPPARGATDLHRRGDAAEGGFQSTPPARGATFNTTNNNKGNAISIHAPREGGDSWGVKCATSRIGFQSTPPARGATLPTPPRTKSTGISIHAPREGGDPPVEQMPVSDAISIHAPREGGDRQTRCLTRSTRSFQSTPPARGATSV